MAFIKKNENPKTLRQLNLKKEVGTYQKNFWEVQERRHRMAFFFC